VSDNINQGCSQLTGQLLECLSIALDLGPTESLRQHHNGSMFVSSLIHYPATPIEIGEIIRGPAHSDLGTLTLLFQYGVGGLQVADMNSTDKISSAAVNKSAKFLDIEPDHETILVNIGYLLMRWTNGRWKNTVHRVSEPPLANSINARESGDPRLVPERYSIAFFIFPDAETNIEPFDSCCRDKVRKNWGPIKAGDYLFQKRGDLLPKV
jgi:isopenicillin N synthase-like dioxygenase